MQKERTAKYITSEVIMETLFWIIFAIVISKVLLKAIRPDINRALNNKVKEYWKKISKINL